MGSQWGIGMRGLSAGLITLGLLAPAGMERAIAQSAPTTGKPPAATAPAADEPLTRIVGGRKAADGAWPSQVKIYAPDPAGRGRYRSHCGGTVVGANWILTAAHCFVTPSGQGARRQALFAQDVLIVAGESRAPAVITIGDSIARKAVRAKSILYHPDFQPDSFANDIAVIELESAARAPAIPVPPPNAADLDLANVPSTVVGWGFTRETSTFDAALLPADLQEVELPIVDIGTCATAYRDSAMKTNTIDERNVCAGFAAGGRDACRGDSGGPLMVRGQAGGWVQVGVVSWGEGCGRRDRYGVYTRTAAFEPWLRQVTRGELTPSVMPAIDIRLSAADIQRMSAAITPQDGGGILSLAGELFALLSPTDVARSAASVESGDRALVIGIDGYAAPLTLNGSAADATAISDILVNGLGFRREQVMVLTNERATRANILAAFDAWLAQGTRPGSRVFLFYSGHGFQSRVFPALRDAGEGPALAPVDLTLVNDAEGRAIDVRGLISSDDMRRLMARLADRKVTAVFDTSQVSQRPIQRPAVARAEERPFVRSVEAVVELAPDLRDVTVRAGRDPGREWPDGPVTWFAAAPDQMALVDRDAAEPMGVFTRLFVDNLRAAFLMGGGGATPGGPTVATLMDDIRRGTERYCEEAGAKCRLGLTPQLKAPGAVMAAALEATAGRAQGTAVRIMPKVQNAAGLSVELLSGIDLTPGTAMEVKVSARTAGYVMLVNIQPDGRVEQVYPDPALADQPRPRNGKAPRDLTRMNFVAAGKALTIPLKPNAAQQRAIGTGALVAILSDKPVQLIDLPDLPPNAGDALGSLIYIHDRTRSLKVADRRTGGLSDVEWSFDAALYRLRAN